MSRRLLFVAREGTLISRPPGGRVDSLSELRLVPGVIPALLDLVRAGFGVVVVTDQPGLGSPDYPRERFDGPHRAMLDLFESQGVTFDDVLVCGHPAAERCVCRKPGLGLVRPYLTCRDIDLARSYVVGDRPEDVALADNMGVEGIRLGAAGSPDWPAIAQNILGRPRFARVVRKTRETDIEVTVTLDGEGVADIQTGIGFFDHMLEQLARHGSLDLRIRVRGDLHIDEHHTVEDTALALGAALRQAVGDKLGIGRYGFVVPMDEARAHVAVDVGGRPYLVFDAVFHREAVGGLPTELVGHFFRSLADSLGATLHVRLAGDNAHHMIESGFKALARSLRQAFGRTGRGLPSTKGVL